MWLQSMERHVFPPIGNRDTAGLTVQDIVDVLKPIWAHTRDRAAAAWPAEGGDRTCRRHRRSWSLSEWQPGGLGAQAVVARGRQGTYAAQGAALAQAPALYVRLADLDDRRAHAVLFLLLTCCLRTAEVILARWGEIDLSTGPFGDVWHVPGSRVKTGNRHVADARGED